MVEIILINLLIMIWKYRNTSLQNIKVATNQGDNYTTVCLIDYPYFKEKHKLITINSSKQKVLDADPKAIIVN